MSHTCLIITSGIKRLTFTYSLKRVHWEEPVRLVALQLCVDEDWEEAAVLEEARVCMQDSTTLFSLSLVRLLASRLWELLDS